MNGSANDRPSGSGRDSWAMAAVVIAAACLLVAVGAVAIAIGHDDGGGGGGSVSASGETTTVDVVLAEMSVTPSSITVPAGDELVLNVVNEGELPHDLKLAGETGTAMLDPGASESVSLGVITETTEAWCTVPGHKEAGMVLEIVVEGSAPAADLAGGAANAQLDPDASPSDEWVRFDPNLAPAPGGTEHEITLRADETVLEVAPGVTQEMWTFDGQVPGPILRGKVGDLFTVTLVNDGELGHSVDFHSSKVAWSDEMQTIQPGESVVYQYEAKHAGIYMYHCGTAPALHHIGNGMFGAVIIDPPDLAPVDHEYVVVQSEMYFGPEGEPGDLAKMSDDDFDAVVFNGYANQYMVEPISGIEVGERVRFWVLDAGPSENSAFHIVGTIFDTVYREGDYSLRPGALQGGSQALDLQPSQGGFVEMTFDEDGQYLMVTHKFSNVGKGAVGMIVVGDGPAPEGASEG